MKTKRQQSGVPPDTHVQPMDAAQGIAAQTNSATPETEAPDVSDGKGHPPASSAVDSAADKAETWLVEDPAVQNHLWAIVAGLEHDPSQREDLFQEGLLHLWRKEQERPGQTASWYLQGCRFHLQHTIELGHSLDSCKRRWQQVEFALDSYVEPDEKELQASSFALGADPMSEIGARDLLETLRPMLRPSQKAVLDLLEQGYGTCDIARLLGISNKSVIRRREYIQSAAMKIGCQPPSQPWEGGGRSMDDVRIFLKILRTFWPRFSFVYIVRN